MPSYYFAVICHVINFQSILFSKGYCICRSSLITGTIRHTEGGAIYKMTIAIHIGLSTGAFCNANHLVVLMEEHLILSFLGVVPLACEPIEWLYQNDLDVRQIFISQIHEQLGHHGVKAYCSAHPKVAHASCIKPTDNNLCSFAYLFLLP